MSMVIQLLPAWLTHNYLSELFNMRASQMVREVGVTGLQRLLPFLPKGDQGFLGWQSIGGQRLAIKVGKHLANAIGNIRVQSIQVLKNRPLGSGWRGTLVQSSCSRCRRRLLHHTTPQRIICHRCGSFIQFIFRCPWHNLL